MLKRLLLTTILVLAWGIAHAEMWEDYGASKEPWVVTQVKVQPGKLDDYLKNLRRGFVVASEAAKKNGTLLDYQILVHRPSDAAGATVLIIEKYADWSVVAPNKERELRLRTELQKTIPKVDSDKMIDERNTYRTVLDAGTYWSVEFAK